MSEKFLVLLLATTLTANEPKEESHLAEEFWKGIEVPMKTTVIPVKPPKNLTLSEECERTGDCCFHFTWPGSWYEDGHHFDFTCTNYRRRTKTLEPCKDPVVFTYGNESREDRIFRRPNISQVIAFSDNHNIGIYCRKDVSCIKYSFYKDELIGERLWNETRFCGTLLNIRSRWKKAVKSGCYREKLMGYTKEVCACWGDRCNRAAKAFSSSLVLPSLLFLFQFPKLLDIPWR